MDLCLSRPLSSHQHTERMQSTWFLTPFLCRSQVYTLMCEGSQGINKGATEKKEEDIRDEEDVPEKKPCPSEIVNEVF